MNNEFAEIKRLAKFLIPILGIFLLFYFVIIKRNHNIEADNGVFIFAFISIQFVSIIIVALRF
ncbi:MAG: hypothetical protein M0R03_15620 [Novosphingobium sp.]|nr:hypothetical protein [Novosphingobium sp.]